MWLRCGSPVGVLQPGLKLRRQRVKGTSPLVYSDSYHSLSFVCHCWDLVTAVPLTLFIWWLFWTLRVRNYIEHTLCHAELHTLCWSHCYFKMYENLTAKFSWKLAIMTSMCWFQVWLFSDTWMVYHKIISLMIQPVSSGHTYFKVNLKLSLLVSECMTFNF